MMSEETEFTTSTFRCTDPIQNFKIRVVLKPVKRRNIKIPHFDLQENLLSELNDETKNTVEEEKDEEEDYIFSWQEKVFSKVEIAKYSNISNCQNKLHEKYHEDVTKISNNQNYNRKLFTYVDSDNYKLKDEHINLVEGGKGYICALAKQINDIEVSNMPVRNFRNAVKKKIVNYSPSDEFKKQRHLAQITCQKMFIMVDLGLNKSEIKKDEPTSEEFLICQLVYDQINKILKITPSFSKEINTKPYCIGINNQYSKCAYQYWLYHASLGISKEDSMNEKRIMNKILLHQSELRKLQTGTEFAAPPSDYVKVTILGEIISAQCFDYDYVTIRYIVNLPSGWHCNDPDALTGITHMARSNARGTTHLCHLFNLDLAFNLTQLKDYSAYLPCIFFEVLSVDKWKIYRNEGYAYITLPKNAGIHDYDLTCWRAADNSVRSNLERFFIGGSQILEDVSYVGCGTKTHNKRLMSRFGLQTEPTGRLEIKLNIIHQSEAFKCEKERKSNSSHNIFGTLNTSTLLGSVNAVLEAFRQAREKMLKAKESLRIGLD